MADDEYVEGDSGSEPADPPGAVPADDGGARERPAQGGFDSSSVSDAPVLQKQRATARNAAARKAFAEAILANKGKATETPSEALELDPEAAPLVPAAKAAGAEAPKPPDVAPASAPPPAPSLDPEVRKLREEIKQERAALAAERAELEKQKAKPPEPLPDANSYEDYIDSAPRAYRNWLESMRGEKFASDDEFKREVQDFVTTLSSDVLGVPLPENVRAAFDAAQAKKIVRTHKTIQTRKEAAAAAQAEKERAAAAEREQVEEVERQWAGAAGKVGAQFAPLTDAEGNAHVSDAAKAYPWLAAEDEPGKIVVDVIRAALSKDGTKLTWQDAARQANDYLKTQAEGYFNKRKALMTPAAPAAESPKPKQPPPAPPPAPPPPAPPADKKWSRDKHMENTRAAFRAAIAAKSQ